MQKKWSPSSHMASPFSIFVILIAMHDGVRKEQEREVEWWDER